MTVVTKTIGTSSRDYSTVTLWEADLDDSGIYSASDDAVGEMYDDSAFDESPTINGGVTVGLATRTLTVASGERHDGTAGTGARIVRTTTVSTGIYSDVINTTFEWFEFDGNSNTITSIIRVNRPYNVVRNCIAHNAVVPTNSTGMGIGITAESPFSANSHAYNNIVYDFGANTRCQPRGINWIRADSQVANFYNNTVFNIFNNANDLQSQGFFNTNGSANRTYTNNVACDVTNAGAGGAACFSIGSGTISYCASSDSTATGTGSLTSITTANQFVSTTGGSEDLHLKANSDCIRAGTDLGTTPTNVNIDIDGYDRDAGGKGWSIGAHEWVRTTTVTIGTTGRDYSTFTLWDADMDSHSGGLSVGDDVVADIYDDSAFNETLNYNGNTNGYDSVTFKAADGERHDGTAGTGVRNIVASGGGTVMAFSSQPNLLVEGIEVGCSAITDRREALLTIQGTSTAHNNARVSKCIVHDAYQWASGGGIVLGGYFAQNYVIENCIVYDWGIRTASTTQYDRGGITSTQFSRTGCQVLNCTVYNVQSYDNPGTQVANCYNLHSSILVKNCIGVEAEDDCFYGTQTQTTNMSSDATASGVTLVTVADQFVSTVGGSEDLHLKAGSDAIDAGTDLGTSPTGVNIDIDGRDRDAEGDTWDIGADEYVAAAPSSNVKKFNGVAYANIKKINGVSIANIKKINGIA